MKILWLCPHRATVWSCLNYQLLNWVFKAKDELHSTSPARTQLHKLKQVVKIALKCELPLHSWQTKRGMNSALRKWSAFSAHGSWVFCIMRVLLQPCCRDNMLYKVRLALWNRQFLLKYFFKKLKDKDFPFSVHFVLFHSLSNSNNKRTEMQRIYP